MATAATIKKGTPGQLLLLYLLQTVFGQVLPLLLLVHDGEMGLDLFPAGTVKGIPAKDDCTGEQKHGRYEKPCSYDTHFSRGALHALSQ